MLKLFYFPRSGNSREVRILLAEKAILHEAIDIRQEGFDAAGSGFLRASPRGTVPAIVHGDVSMNESFIINKYLNDAFSGPSFLPDESDARSAIDQWVALWDRKLVDPVGYLLIECLMTADNEKDARHESRLRKSIGNRLAELDECLRDKEYLFGEISLADIALAPHISALSRVGISLDGYSSVNLWMSRIRSRPSFSATAS